jgi:hypothetical protein
VRAVLALPLFSLIPFSISDEAIDLVLHGCVSVFNNSMRVSICWMNQFFIDGKFVNGLMDEQSSTDSYV